jgi:uncharacterized protein (DUF2126 family)
MQDYELLRERLLLPQHMWHSKRQFLADLNTKNQHGFEMEINKMTRSLRTA